MMSFNEIIKHYEEPHRVYHDKNHIFRMINDLNNTDLFIQRSAENYFRIYTAICYHDIVYDLKPSVVSNEVKSANFFQADFFGNILEYEEIMNMTYSRDRFEDINNMIRATEFHFTKPNDNSYKSENLKIILDLDILSFSDDYELFVDTNEKITQEYINAYDIDVVRKNRKAFLTTILETNSLRYYIVKDKEDRTKKAYDNIKRYLTEQY